MKYIYLMLLFVLICCKSSTERNNSILKQEGKIGIFYNSDSTVSVDIFNWQDSLPDSIYNKKVISIAIMENSNIKLRKSFLQCLQSFSISESRLDKDTLFLDSTFKNLDYLSLIQPKCIVVNLDSIKIRKLDYFSSKNEKYQFNLNLSKINGLDSLLINAPNEHIEIPINKDYKYIAPCTKNNQVRTLKKYYKNVVLWFQCN